MAGAKEGVTFLAELRTVGFTEARILRTIHNARTSNPKVIAAEYWAKR